MTKPPNLSSLRQMYTDTLVWVDEAHNVALSANQLVNRKFHAKEETYWALYKLFHEVDHMKIVLSTATPMLNEANEIISLVNLLRPETGRPPADWNWRDTDDATFKARFPEAAELGFDRKTERWSAVVPHFVGQTSPTVDVGRLTPEDMEQHFRGLFVYSRQDPVGVSIRYVGKPGKVNPKDEASKRSLAGNTTGYVKVPK